MADPSSNLFIFSFKVWNEQEFQWNLKWTVMKKFLSKILVLSIPVILGFIALGIYNWWLDPYGVLRKPPAEIVIAPNQRLLKTRFILENPDKFNAFVFGSSRGEKLDVRLFKDGMQWYNFSWSEALPAEMLQEIRYLQSHGVEMRKILVALDEFSYQIDPQIHLTQPLRKAWRGDYTLYLEYLFLRPDRIIRQSVLGASEDPMFTPNLYQSIYTDGVFPRTKKDAFINQNPLLHLRDSVFLQPYKQPYFRLRTEEALQETKEIIEYCKSNGIELTLLINPVFIVTLAHTDSAAYCKYFGKLSELQDLYDFNRLTHITINPLNYYENSHFRPAIGDTMIQYLSSPEKFARIRVQTFPRHDNQKGVCAGFPYINALDSLQKQSPAKPQD